MAPLLSGAEGPDQCCETQREMGTEVACQAPQHLQADCIHHRIYLPMMVECNLREALR